MVGVVYGPGERERDVAERRNGETKVHKVSDVLISARQPCAVSFGAPTTYRRGTIGTPEAHFRGSNVDLGFMSS